MTRSLLPCPAEKMLTYFAQVRKLDTGGSKPHGLYEFAYLIDNLDSINNNTVCKESPAIGKIDMFFWVFQGIRQFHAGAGRIVVCLQAHPEFGLGVKNRVRDVAVFIRNASTS